MFPRWFKILTAFLCIVLGCTLLLRYQTRKMQQKFAWVTMTEIRRIRDQALVSESGQAVKILGILAEGNNMKQRPGSDLDTMCSQARSNAVADIIAYLRKQTGTDLGDDPQAWVRKYGAEQIGAANRSQPIPSSGSQPKD